MQAKNNHTTKTAPLRRPREAHHPACVEEQTGTSTTEKEDHKMTFLQTVKHGFGLGVGGSMGWALGSWIARLFARLFKWVIGGVTAWMTVYGLAHAPMPDVKIHADKPAIHSQQHQKGAANAN